MTYQEKSKSAFLFVSEVIENGYHVKQSLETLKSKLDLNDNQIEKIEDSILKFKYGNSWDDLREKIDNIVDYQGRPVTYEDTVGVLFQVGDHLRIYHCADCGEDFFGEPEIVKENYICGLCEDERKLEMRDSHGLENAED